MPDQFHDLTIGTCHRRLPVVPVSPTVRIAFMDIVGDIELMDAALAEVWQRCPAGIEVILGGDTVGMVIAHHLSLRTNVPYVVARKKRTPAMVNPITAEAQSVAAVAPSTFWLGEHHVVRLRDRHVLVVDEVASTGSTLRALTDLAHRAGAAEVTRAVIATEGTPRPDIVSVVHLPVWEIP
jgi:adenine phosphoribosyltransferase